jgi:hypothetical protein
MSRLGGWCRKRVGPDTPQIVCPAYVSPCHHPRVRATSREVHAGDGRRESLRVARHGPAAACRAVPPNLPPRSVAATGWRILTAASCPFTSAAPPRRNVQAAEARRRAAAGRRRYRRSDGMCWRGGNAAAGGLSDALNGVVATPALVGAPLGVAATSGSSPPPSANTTRGKRSRSCVAWSAAVPAAPAAAPRPSNPNPPYARS